MAISVACQCGKRFQANEKLAGKRVLCPVCGAAINVPAAPGSPATSAADPFGLSGAAETSAVENALSKMPLPQAGFQAPSPYTGGYVPQANYGQQYAPPPKNTNTALIIGIIAGVVGIGFVMLIGVALLLPAVQAAREAARRQAAKGNNSPNNQPNIGGPSSRPKTNNTAPPGAFGTPAPNAAGASSRGWQTYNSAAGRYSVLMPPNVKTRSQSEVSPAGLLTAHMAIAEVGAQGAYFVAHTDMPVAASQISTDEALDGACNGAVSRVRGTEISRETTTFAGQPARDLTFEGQQAGQHFRTRVKVFLAGRRLYQVMWLGPAGGEPAEDLQKFFDSFQLTGTVDTGSQLGGVAPPLGGGAPAAGGGQLAEGVRKSIYREVQTFRRSIERITQQRDDMAGRGVPTTALDNQIESLKKSEETRLQQICQRHRITREKLDEIIGEGDANGWGNR